MEITVRHRRHWVWQTLPAGQQPQRGERVKPLDPARPEIVAVQRLIDEPAGETHLSIPDSALDDIARDQAAVREGAIAEDGTLLRETEPTEQDRIDVLVRHLRDIVDARGRHAPIDHWTAVEVDGDDRLSQELSRRLLQGQA